MGDIINSVSFTVQVRGERMIGIGVGYGAGWRIGRDWGWRVESHTLHPMTPPV